MNELRVEPQSNRRRKRRTAGVPEKTSLPWKNIRNSLPPIEPLSTDEIESIHQASLRVLAELGMKVTDTEARTIYAEGGARVDRAEELVYLDPEMVVEVIKTVPAEYTLNARNSDKSITIGGNHIPFSGVAGPAFVSDLDRGRRPGRFDRAGRENFSIPDGPAEVAESRRLGAGGDVLEDPVQRFRRNIRKGSDPEGHRHRATGDLGHQPGAGHSAFGQCA